MASKVDDLSAKLSALKISDSQFYGLQGLSKTTTLYRVCRYDELDGKGRLSTDIVSKRKKEDTGPFRSVEQHVNSGGNKDSRFISTTTSSYMARRWAFYTKEKRDEVAERDKPLPIIVINLSKIPEEQEKSLVNLTNGAVRDHFVKGVTQINRAKSSKEVLFQWKIPKAMFEKWEDPPKPDGCTCDSQCSEKSSCPCKKGSKLCDRNCKCLNDLNDKCKNK